MAMVYADPGARTLRFSKEARGKAVEVRTGARAPSGYAVIVRLRLRSRASCS